MIRNITGNQYCNFLTDQQKDPGQMDLHRRTGMQHLCQHACRLVCALLAGILLGVTSSSCLLQSQDYWQCGSEWLSFLKPGGKSTQLSSYKRITKEIVLKVSNERFKTDLKLKWFWLQTHQLSSRLSPPYFPFFSFDSCACHFTHSRGCLPFDFSALSCSVRHKYGLSSQAHHYFLASPDFATVISKL